MGCVCSSPSDDLNNNALCSIEEEPLKPKQSVALGKGRTNAYLGLAMLQANKAAALISTGSVYDAELEYVMAQKLIRKAKNEGCTVSVVDGSLYVDYKFIGYLPPGVQA